MEIQESFYAAHTDFEYPEEEEADINEFRERALEMIRVMSLAMSFIVSSKTPNVAAFGVAYALGLTSVLGNERMAQRAKKLGVNKSAISRSASQFIAESGLPPSLMMQQCEHVASMRRTSSPIDLTGRKNPKSIMREYDVIKNTGGSGDQMLLNLFKA